MGDFNIPPSIMARTTRQKISKGIEELIVPKDTIRKLKRQPAEWKKIFANLTPDKGLVFRTYKELLQLYQKPLNYVLNIVNFTLYDFNPHKRKKKCIQKKEVEKKCFIGVLGS